MVEADWMIVVYQDNENSLNARGNEKNCVMDIMFKILGMRTAYVMDKFSDVQWSKQGNVRLNLRASGGEKEEEKKTKESEDI